MTKYSLMTVGEICSLPVGELAADSSHLYLWTTNAFMVEAHEVASAWGYKQKTILTWCKVKPDGTPSRKMGYYYRGATEHCLFCVRGKLRLNTRMRPTAFLWPRIGEHSRKPDQFFDMVEQETPGPRLELFARRPRLGWTVWGNAVNAVLQPNHDA
jgi:N6-adenosine-specific RNA methylase IME4